MVFKKILKKVLTLGVGIFFISGCGSSGTIIPQIPLTLDPLVLANPISMAASSAGNRLYIVNSNNRVLWNDASFVVMDISNPVAPVAIAVISIANFSGQITLDEVRGFVYIPNRLSSSDADENDQILRININEASPGFLSVELFDSGDSPFGAFFVNGTDFYIAATAEALRYNVNNFAGYSLVDLSVVTNVDRDINAISTRELSITPSGSNLFVTNRADNMLILNVEQFSAPPPAGILNLGTEPVDYIVVGTNSTRGITRDSMFVYVVDGVSPALKIMTDAGLAPVVGAPVEISSSSLQVASITVGFDPGEVIVDEPNMRAYVSNTGSDDVSVIDLTLEQEIARISIATVERDEEDVGDPNEGDQPFGMALVNIGGTNYLYVAHFLTNLVSIINVDNLTIVGMFPEAE